MAARVISGGAIFSLITRILTPGRGGPGQFPGIGRIDGGGGPATPGRPGAAPQRPARPRDPGATNPARCSRWRRPRAGDPVGKEGHPVFHPGDALHLDKQQALTQIQAQNPGGCPGEGNLGRGPGRERQSRQAAGRPGPPPPGGWAPGCRCTSSLPRRRTEAPGIGGLAPGPGLFGKEDSPGQGSRQPVRAPVLGTWTQVRRSSGQCHLGQETLFTPQKDTGNEGSNKAHGGK